MAKQNTVIIIAGPTAVGKTSQAITVAKHYDAEIISADSRQCYRELKIGVARPSEKELAEVRHHFIASHSIHDKVDASTFEKFALQKSEELFQSSPIVVMTGGTGLYIKAFCEGLDEIPEVPDLIRKEINYAYQANGLSWLQEEVRKLDPLFYNKGEILNPHRLLRALEVFKATGRSIIDFRRGEKVQRNFNIIKIGLQLPKEQLHSNINERVERMMEEGLLEEVRSLLPYQHIKALQTVGYQEVFDHFNGELGLPEAVANIKKNTRQYAKRQMTWFKKDKDLVWFNSGTDIVKTYLDNVIAG